MAKAVVKVDVFKAKITHITKLGYSAIGNPFYEVVTDSGTYETHKDAAVNYTITNHLNENVELTIENNEIAYAKRTIS